MKKNIINKIFIYAFLFLYGLVAFISFCHAIEFFDIGNVNWMSIMLAFAFELGLAVCLASILIGTNKRNNIAWVLLVILVLVQVVGNTYSVFKYISVSEAEYYTYLAKPLLFFIEDVSEETVQIIISWIMGAILPIVALLMTEMVANGIKEQQMEDLSENEKESNTEQISTDSEDIDTDVNNDTVMKDDDHDDLIENSDEELDVSDEIPKDKNEPDEKSSPSVTSRNKFFQDVSSKHAEKIYPEQKQK